MSFSFFTLIYGISSKKIFTWYKNHLSGYENPGTKESLQSNNEVDRETGEKIEIPILKEENFGEEMCIDDKNLGGEGYTIISNSQTGKIAVMAKTTKIDPLKRALDKIPSKTRRSVKIMTKDLALNYDWLSRQYFSFADRIADKFHVIKMGFDALQSIRIRLRQEILTQERVGKKQKREKRIFENGDTEKQLLARSRGLLFMFPSQWSVTQEERAKILFREYPVLYESYTLMLEFRRFYNEKDRKKAEIKLKKWQENVQESKISEMLNFCYQTKTHQSDILMYFTHRKTNAIAEGINSHLQRFFISNYGIRNRDFFHFRIKMMFS